LLACQVKTLSFLTYLLRGFAELMRPFEGEISAAIIKLLKCCPPEAVNTRKEVFVATRHILATDFRNGDQSNHTGDSQGFFQWMDGWMESGLT
jgi:transformation/transcription domain-associated protein